MGFLGKIAKVAITTLKVLGGIELSGAGTSVGNVASRVYDPLTEIVKIIQTIEIAGAALTSPVHGAEKLKMAGPLVRQVILSNLVAGRKIEDTDRFTKGTDLIISGVAEVMSSLDENAVDEIDPEDV